MILQQRKMRRELPPTKKLDLKFDIEKLRADLHTLDTQSPGAWNGLNNEYANLCKTHSSLPKFFIGADEDMHSNSSYLQLALTEFDQSFDLSQRAEKSGTVWDQKSPKNQAIADERFYRKQIAAMPSYLIEVLKYFSPHLHRSRLSKLMPGKEVLPHIDYDTTYSIRLHIPIETNPEATMGVNYFGKIHEEHWPADGSVYFVNQGCLHWAKNLGKAPRTHLILSIDSQKFLN